MKLSFSWVGLVVFALPMLINVAYVAFSAYRGGLVIQKRHAPGGNHRSCQPNRLSFPADIFGK